MKVVSRKVVLFLGILCAGGAINLSAQTFNPLVSFDYTDGALPYSSMIQGTDGNYYGTTIDGGLYGRGVVYKLTSGGTLSTVYSFCAQSNCTDGAEPFGAVVQAANGDFYGATYSGGANSNSLCLYSTGCGTVFKLTPAGVLTTLYSFCAQTSCSDGSAPNGGLVQGANGDFYGTTLAGGADNYGTVFKITPAGVLTTLQSFDDTDGYYPDAGLTLATNGYFYGTTLGGGAHYGGSIFKISAAGTLTTVYSFCAQEGCTDGYGPYDALIQASNGNLYGVVASGGAGTESACDLSGGAGWGTIFEITPGGAFTLLHTFEDTDGATPDGSLVQATDGNLYGTTACGGTNGAGTIFKIGPDGGTLTSLYSYAAPPPTGAGANQGLLQATNGTFYGTTTEGGTDSDGLAFSLSVGLSAFVETQPTSGKVGTPVKILGNNLTGTSAVTFNGTAASFSVSASGTYINTKVPTGATTGYVKVTTPGGVLTSNVKFRVLP